MEKEMDRQGGRGKGWSKEEEDRWMVKVAREGRGLGREEEGLGRVGWEAEEVVRVEGC